MAPSDLSSFLAGEPPPADAGIAGAAPASNAAGSGMPASDRGQGSASAKVLLNERFEIDSARPIPEFHHVGADAVAARRLESSSVELFAYVVRSGLPARNELLPAMRAIDHASVMKLVSHGVAYWPPDGVERQIVVYERPPRRFLDSIGTKIAPMREDEVARMLVRPIAEGLEELKRLRIAHGAVNPANLFVAGGDGRRLILGDCVTAPTGFIQHSAFETIGRAMAEPAGRGTATAADDLYALGVTMLFMLLGHLPGCDLDEEALITAKIESGSFSALLGDSNLPQYITEPVRGLLLDNPDLRWTLDDLQTWLGGRRASPKRSEVVGRLRRPVPFLGQSFTNVRTLAAAMATDSVAADGIIEDGTLETSLAQAANEDDMRTRIAEARRTASQGRGGSLRDRRVSRVLMALDPQAPIRYRGQSVMPEGVGSALAQAFATGRGIQELGEIIAGQLPMAWYSFQSGTDEGAVPLLRIFDTLSGFVSESGFGYGIERCLYELETSTPCAGPLTKGQLILDSKSLLLALESVAAGSNRPNEPIDRHAAAFLISRHARLIHEPIMVLSGDATPEQRCAALVKIFDILQRRTNISKLPRLCGWLVSLAEPAIGGYHSRSLRDRLKTDIAKVWKSGRIHDLVAFISDAGLADRDKSGFRAATAAHAHASRSIAACRRELERRGAIAAAYGRQAAAIIASLLSVMMAIGVVMMTVL